MVEASGLGGAKTSERCQEVQDVAGEGWRVELQDLTLGDGEVFVW